MPREVKETAICLGCGKEFPITKRQQTKEFCCKCSKKVNSIRSNAARYKKQWRIDVYNERIQELEMYGITPDYA